MIIFSDVIKAARSEDEIEVSDMRRKELANRGKLLLERYCGTQGTGICAESFAEYHMWRGEYTIVRDFLTYLEGKLSEYNSAQDPRLTTRIAMTENLIQRIGNLLITTK